MPALTDSELTALFSSHFRMVHYWANRHARDHDAEELAAATFLRAWSRRHGYDPHRPTRNGRPPFPAWLRWQFRAVLQQSQERNARRLTRPLTVAFADPSPGPAERLARAEAVVAVRHALDRLPPDAKALLAGRAAGRTLKEMLPTAPQHHRTRRLADALTELRSVLRSVG